jgi:hypothetical protein
MNGFASGARQAIPYMRSPSMAPFGEPVLPDV